jgi:hypothetical protein
LALRIVWTNYMQYRAKIRGYDLKRLEEIVTGSTERYFDIETGTAVIVGRYDKKLVLIPFEVSEDRVTPITVHATTRQQINLRLRTGRFINE